MSTESGIPDFRSQDGLYNMKYDYPPEEILSNSFFRKNIKEFYRFYKDKMIIKGVKPNYAHYFLKKLEEGGKLTSIVTHNIDGLHQEAGSTNVLEVNGKQLVKVVSWYDNEMSYTAQMVRTAKYLMEK